MEGLRSRQSLAFIEQLDTLQEIVCIFDTEYSYCVGY